MGIYVHIHRTSVLGSRYKVHPRLCGVKKTSSFWFTSLLSEVEWRGCTYLIVRRRDGPTAAMEEEFQLALPLAGRKLFQKKKKKKKMKLGLWSTTTWDLKPNKEKQCQRIKQIRLWEHSIQTHTQDIHLSPGTQQGKTVPKNKTNQVVFFMTANNKYWQKHPSCYFLLFPAICRCAQFLSISL